MDNSTSIFNDLTKFITAIDLQDYITDSVNDEFVSYFEHLGNKSKLFSAPLVRLANNAAKTPQTLTHWLRLRDSARLLRMTIRI